MASIRKWLLVLVGSVLAFVWLGTRALSKFTNSHNLFGIVLALKKTYPKHQLHPHYLPWNSFIVELDSPNLFGRAPSLTWTHI